MLFLYMYLEAFMFPAFQSFIVFVFALPVTERNN